MFVPGLNPASIKILFRIVNSIPFLWRFRHTKSYHYFRPYIKYHGALEGARILDFEQIKEVYLI